MFKMLDASQRDASINDTIIHVCCVQPPPYLHSFATRN